MGNYFSFFPMTFLTIFSAFLILVTIMIFHLLKISFQVENNNSFCLRKLTCFTAIWVLKVSAI